MQARLSHCPRRGDDKHELAPRGSSEAAKRPMAEAGGGCADHELGRFQSRAIFSPGGLLCWATALSPSLEPRYKVQRIDHTSTAHSSGSRHSLARSRVYGVGGRVVTSRTPVFLRRQSLAMMSASCREAIIVAPDQFPSRGRPSGDWIRQFPARQRNAKGPNIHFFQPGPIISANHHVRCRKPFVFGIPVRVHQTEPEAC